MNILKSLGWLGGITIVLAVLFYLTCLNHVHLNEEGISYNTLTGDVQIQKQPRWYITSPFVLVAKVSMLPITVHIPSDAKVINTKIVRLKEDGLVEFVQMQGFSYQLGNSLDNILMGYAFSGEKYPFLEVLQEAGEEIVVDRKLTTKPPTQ